MSSSKRAAQSATAPSTRRFAAQRNHIARAATMLALGLGTWTAASAQAASDWAAGRLLVMPRAGLSADALAKTLKPHGGRATRIGQSNLHIVQLPAGVSEQAVQAQLAHHPLLKFAELDRRVSVNLVPNDPYLGSEWHLAKINAGAAWDMAQGAGVTIAICDSGVLPTHPDLVQVAGWNFVDNNSNTADVYGHGTSVAGTAAAVVNNGTGVAGVAGAARIMPIRVSDSTGYAYYSAVASCVTFAADRGARVANASFAGVYSSSAVQSAGQYLKNKGGLLVVSAGNSGVNDGSPAITSMIPVSATDANDARTSWSSYGSYVALAAPGAGIWTTGADGGYRAPSGTSFSSPMTAGVVALMMSVNPALSSSQIESLLYTTAVDLGTAGRDVYFGHGRIDANAAVRAASTAVAADTTPPSVVIASPQAGTTASGVANIDVTASDNVGVKRVDLKVNGTVVASDTVGPYLFSWDSSTVANGTASLVAVAYDAAGNSKASTAVSVNVSNQTPQVAADTTPPTVAITQPVGNTKVGSGTVSVSVKASDNAGTTGLKGKLYIDGVLVASGTGASLSYNWNTRKASSGTHTLTAVAQDAAGNSSTTSVSVIK